MRTRRASGYAACLKPLKEIVSRIFFCVAAHKDQRKLLYGIGDVVDGLFNGSADLIPGLEAGEEQKTVAGVYDCDEVLVTI